MFLIFNFWSWIFDKSSEPLHAKMPLILLLVRFMVCMCSSRDLFRQTVIFFAKPYSINAGVTSIVLWVAAWEWRTSSFCNRNQKRAWLWWIFSSSNSAPANGKTGFYANRTEQAGGWDHFCMERLRTLNSYKIFKIKNKKIKTYSGWCPFKVLSNDTTLMQIQSDWTVPLILGPSVEIGEIGWNWVKY